jgi:hypothetical protein
VFAVEEDKAFVPNDPLKSGMDPTSYVMAQSNITGIGLANGYSCPDASIMSVRPITSPAWYCNLHLASMWPRLHVHIQSRAPSHNYAVQLTRRTPTTNVACAFSDRSK